MVKGLSVLDNIKFVNRLAYLIGAFAVFIIFASTVLYILQNWFTIDRISIKGNTAHITREQLSYIAKNRLRGTFFTLDINRLQREFLQIPWVQSVTVNREFPDTITVYINEYEAIARLGDEGLVSSSGSVFTGADDSTTLPTFNGLVSQIPYFLNDYKVLKPFAESKNINLIRLDLSGSGITKLYFSNDLEVVICALDISQGVQVLSKYWDKLYQLNPNLNYINMCYKNAVAINSAKSVQITDTNAKDGLVEKGKSQ
ncbi:MAG TPA: FtsQ-type POTRA domain-containing protein [Aquella sp.]|nr:FtsQ-type POTRA domain-containing protein [Aquella sp.]